MESTETLKVVQKYLQVLGIEPEATMVYVELTKQGPSSALQLSKITGISRTQTYRRLEDLQASGLASAEQLSYGTLFRALPFENVEALIAQREAENVQMKGSMGEMVNVLQQMAGGAGSKATVQHYYGLAGLKQVNWNLTNADKEFRVFEATHLSQRLDKVSARRHRERCIERELTSYNLTNDETIRAKDLEPFEPSRTFLRHIDREILTLNFEVYIYNDVVALLDYSKDQQLAMEIHHPTLHTMMRQLFEAMWNMATPLEIT
jgi:sugar-specific transcriptional regulator TrmB